MDDKHPIRGRGLLTWSKVREARRWAGREGWGRSRAEQTKTLAVRYGTSYQTMRDVLVNQSWYDPAYKPGERDPLMYLD